MDYLYMDEAGETSIQSGASIEVIQAYELRDACDVDVEITDCMGQYEGNVKRTIRIS